MNRAKLLVFTSLRLDSRWSAVDGRVGPQAVGLPRGSFIISSHTARGSFISPHGACRPQGVAPGGRFCQDRIGRMAPLGRHQPSGWHRSQVVARRGRPAHAREHRVRSVRNHFAVPRALCPAPAFWTLADACRVQTPGLLRRSLVSHRQTPGGGPKDGTYAKRRREGAARPMSQEGCLTPTPRECHPEQFATFTPHLLSSHYVP